jgi:hypothetical protein
MSKLEDAFRSLAWFLNVEWSDDPEDVRDNCIEAVHRRDAEAMADGWRGGWGQAMRRIQKDAFRLQDVGSPAEAAQIGNKERV